MLRRIWLCLLLLLSVPALSFAQAAPPAQEADPLEPVLFLVGKWDAQGQGPYGPYRTETTITRRGRWLLSTSDAFDPKSGRKIFTNVWVYGYENDGSLRCHVFDTAGVFVFTGTREADGVRFDWRDGEEWKSFTITRHADGSLKSRYWGHLPSPPPGLSADYSFDGTWRPAGSE